MQNLFVFGFLCYFGRHCTEKSSVTFTRVFIISKSVAKLCRLGAIIGKNNLSIRFVVHVQYNNLVDFTVGHVPIVQIHFDSIWVKPARPIYSVVHLLESLKKTQDATFFNVFNK